MAINYERLMALKNAGVEYSYGDREVMLYALGVGLGRDPLNQNELAYVYEQNANALKTVPTVATVLTWSTLLHNCGWDYSKVLHGEQRLTLHRPLPASADLIADAYVTEAYDKGADKGALICTETAVRLKSDNQPLYTLGSTVFARGDGGFGGPQGSGPVPHPMPQREPDMRCELATHPNQALLYRLNGDRNPLHADPELAQRVGFPVPILHGLCTYGFACHAVLKTVCDYDYALIRAFDVRFSAPVYPGETIITDIWRDDNIVSFQCTLKERDVVAIKNGRCVLAA